MHSPERALSVYTVPYGLWLPFISPENFEYLKLHSGHGREENKIQKKGIFPIHRKCRFYFKSSALSTAEKWKEVLTHVGEKILFCSRLFRKFYEWTRKLTPLLFRLLFIAFSCALNRLTVGTKEVRSAGD